MLIHIARCCDGVAEAGDLLGKGSPPWAGERGGYIDIVNTGFACRSVGGGEWKRAAWYCSEIGRVRLEGGGICNHPDGSRFFLS